MPHPPEPQAPQTVHESLRDAYQAPPNATEPPASEHQLRSQPLDRQPARPGTSPAKKRSKKFLKLLIILVLLAGLIGGGLYAYPKYVKANPFTPDIQTNADFSLFYPTKLPAGYTIDKSTIKLTNGVVIYAAANGDLRIIFTIQKTPPSFDFNTFYSQALSNSQQFATPYGQVVIGKSKDRYLGSLVSGSTWVIVSDSSPSISIDDLSLAMTHLKKY